MNSEQLINELGQMSQKNRDDVQSFKKRSDEELNYKSNEESWSILECIEHLNRYGDFYIPEISKRIKNSSFQKSPVFKSGIIGNYFAKSMLPKENLNRMKTFKSMNPNKSVLDRSVLDKFISQQDIILGLLAKARNTDLSKVKTSISISKWMKLRLGDTFRVVIYHNLRHVIQAKRVLKLKSPEEYNTPARVRNSRTV
jgi:hypothetical protein